MHRLTGKKSSSCSHWPQPETSENILLRCSAYTDERRDLIAAYDRQGLTATNVEEILFPKTHTSVIKPVLSALIAFLEDTALHERLRQWMSPLSPCEPMHFTGL